MFKVSGSRFESLFYLLLPLLFLTACSETSYNKKTAKDVVVVDVREKGEVADGRIVGAFWFPLSEVKTDPAATIKEVKKISQGKVLHVYCRSGKRAQRFIDLLEGQGIQTKNIGGYESLVDQGYRGEKIDPQNLKSGMQML